MSIDKIELPSLDCGLCGFRKCADLAARLADDPGLIKRCIPLSEEHGPKAKTQTPPSQHRNCMETREVPSTARGETAWRDNLAREFDFYLEHFPEEPGPREIILPHNPMLTREIDVHPGDTLIGRPLGMSCGCPITHCGVAMDVDNKTGVIAWCVTGPLNPRQNGYKDLGYYAAEAYEGLIKDARCEIMIGMRYFFQPRMCMLQWRHSGLVNYLNRTPEGLQVRVEGLWIG